MKIYMSLVIVSLLSGCANLAPPRTRVTPYLQDLHERQVQEPSPYKPGDALLCTCPPGTRLFSEAK